MISANEELPNKWMFVVRRRRIKILLEVGRFPFLRLINKVFNAVTKLLIRQKEELPPQDSIIVITVMHFNNDRLILAQHPDHTDPRSNRIGRTNNSAVCASPVVIPT